MNLLDIAKESQSCKKNLGDKYFRYIETKQEWFNWGTVIIRKNRRDTLHKRLSVVWLWKHIPLSHEFSRQCFIGF